MRIGLGVNAVQWDGAIQTTVSLARILRAAGHDVTVLAPMSARRARHRLPVGLGYLGLRPRWWESDVALRRRLRRLVDRAGFDLLFLMAGLPLPHLLAVLDGLPGRTALIPVALGHRRHVYDTLVRLAGVWNAALTISPALQAKASSLFPGRPVLPLTLDVALPALEDLKGRRRLREGDALRLLYVGRLFGRKNVLLLPDILRHCVGAGLSVHLTIIGDGPDRPALEQALAALSLGECVVFATAGNEAELYRLYRDHHMLVFPSLPGEGLGLVLLEAQANGCLPVASLLPGVTDYAITDGVTGRLAAIGDAAGFARAIADMAVPATWQRMSDAAMADLRERFPPGRTARELLAVVDQVAAGRLPVDRRAPLPSAAASASRLPWIVQAVGRRLDRWRRR